MDLRFTDEERAFRQEVRDWIDANLPADTRERLAAGRTPTKQMQVDWQKKLNAKGWCVPHWPAEWGGQKDWSAIKRFILLEELQGTPAPIPLGFNCNMLGPVLIAFGTEEQKKFFLPKLANLDLWFCQGFSEPGAGSDLASLKTRAVREGDHYIVNGQKTWTTLAQYADWIFLLVRTNPEAAKQQEGISFLVVDMKTPGITVRPIITLDGEHEVNEVWFDNVEVPAENLIGEENKGWTYAKHLLSHERTNIADVNRAKRELERLKRIAKAEGVWEDARFRDQIALLEVDIVALEMMVLRVLSAEKSGKQSLDVAGLLKIRGSEIQQRYTELMLLAAGPASVPLVREAMEAGWQGDQALTALWPGEVAQAAPLAGTYFNYRKTSIYGGSNEVQRNIVAQTVLG